LNTFQYYSSIARRDPFIIHMYGFLDFVQHAGLYNKTNPSKNCKSNHMDTIYASCLSQEPEIAHSNNPSSGLVRYEFLEALVRLAVHKYILDGACKRPSEALEKLCRNHLSEEEETSLNDFRNERLYNEPVSVVLDAFEPFLRQVFREFSNRTSNKSKSKNTISVYDWTAMCEYFGLYEKQYGYSEHISILDFLSGRMLVIRDFENIHRFRYSTFTDFLETLCRVADGLDNMNDVSPEAERILQSVGAHWEEDCEQEGHISRHLAFKVHSLFHHMYKIMVKDVPSMKKIKPRYRNKAKTGKQVRTAISNK